MTDVEAELREQFTAAFEGADYPVTNQMDLVPALPDGPRTRFAAGDVNVTALELGMRLSDYQEYPYDSVDELVDDLIQAMKDTDML